MKRYKRNMDEVVSQSWSSASQDQIVAAGERVLHQLRSRADVEETEPIEDAPHVAGFRIVWIAVASAAVLLIAFLVWTANVRLRPTPVAVVEATGVAVDFGEIVHSNGAMGSLLRLADGSRIEMRSQSELLLERASDGVAIRLNSGTVIVTASKQRSGHLYVRTKDVTVSVVGTVFLVNAEAEGSRVAVIEGEVHVQQGDVEKKLRPGEQVVTSARIESQPVSEEISWSRNAGEHLAKLQSAGALPAALPVLIPQDFSHFEVASVRASAPISGGLVPAPNLRGGPGTGDPSRIAWTNTGLINVILRAFDVRRMQIVTPAWVGPERFDIEATISAGATKAQFQTMLQNLLAERFGMKMHHESRMLPVYVMTVAKGGLKLKESSSEPVPEGSKGTWKEDERGFPVPPPEYSGVVGKPTNGRMRLTGQRVGIDRLASEDRLDHPIVDQTGLTGLYDFQIEFEWIRRGAPNVTEASDPAPSARQAIEGLGFKLELQRLPFDVIVIDELEKTPTEN